MMSQGDMPLMRPLPVKKRGERRRWEIMEDWRYDLSGEYEIYIIPRGFIFDGASIPRLFWNILSPTGYLFIAGLIHDYAYKYAGVWTIPTSDRKVPYFMSLSKSEADNIFRDVSDAVSMGESKMTWIAKKALDAFGFMAWNEHRRNDD